MNLAKLKAAIPHILTVVALLIFILYLYQNAEQYRQLLDVSIGLLLLLFGLILLIMLTNGLINLILYRGLGAFLTLNESIGLAAVNTLANQLPFAGGLVAKGVYLKQKHKLAYTHFLSATVALYVWFVSVNGIVGAVIIAYWMFVANTSVSNLLLLGFLAMALSAMLFRFPLKMDIVHNSTWQRRLAQLAEGWQILGQNKRLVQELISLQLMMTLIFAGRFWVAFHILSQDVTLAQCILFAAASILTRLISITPGALGIREVIVAGVASILGFDIGVSVVAVGIDRLVATIVIIGVGTAYTYILSKQAVEAQSEPIPHVEFIQEADNTN